MTNRYLLTCPQIHMRPEDRINELATNIANWINSVPFCELVKLFGGVALTNEPLREQIKYYNQFSDVWDYRRKRANGGERWMVQEDAFLSEHKMGIMKNMSLLGLRDVVEPSIQPDYILPLGGARMANLDRCVTAYEVCMKYQGENIPVVALTGMRPINDIERASLEKYAPDSKTEYEAMCGGMEKAFGLTKSAYEERINTNDNDNLAWAERRYCNDHRQIHILSAPSSDLERRANSMDTFEFFLERYKIEPESRILLVTSCIYVPYQLMKFIDLAIKKNLYVDCIGNRQNANTTSVLNTASYLQELKAAINAIYVLSERYF